MSRSPASLAPMTDRLVRPDWVRRINLMAGSVGGYARDLVPLDAGDLLDTAVAALGGRPDGDLGDPRWQERFEALVAAVDAAGMHVVGRLMTKQELLRSLRTRLLLTAAIDAAPEITRRPVDRPGDHHRPGALGHVNPVRVAGPRPRPAGSHRGRGPAPRDPA